MKKFFSKIAKPFVIAWAAVCAFFSTVWEFIKKYWYKFIESKAMRKVGYVLGYLPNKLSARMTNPQRKAAWGIIFVIPLCIGFVYFFLIPFILTFKYSVSYVAKFSDAPGLTCINVGINNYIYIFKEYVMNGSYTNYEDYPFWRVLLSCGTDIITDLPIILIFSLIMAVVLNSKFRGRTIVRAIFFMPVVFNSQAVDMATKANGMSAIIDANANNIFANMFNFKDFLMAANMPVKLVTFLSTASEKIYDIISYSGIQILIFLSAIQSVPKHLYEAAKMEGCTAYEMFWKITFPMVSPMLLTSAVYTIVDSYTRSVMVSTIKGYSSPTEQAVTLGEGLTGKALELYNQHKNATFVGEYAKLSRYGIGAGMSLLYSVVVIIVIVLVMLILSKVVFYYDE